MSGSLQEEAAVDFVLALRRRWADTVYPHLRTEFDAASAEEPEVSEPLAARVRKLPTYGWFAWLERGSQKMLWRAVGDYVASRPTAPMERPAQGALELDPDLVLPDWYTDWDIHLQPGGVWSSELSAHVYELGAKLVMMGENNDYRFHRLFAETAIAPRPYRRIVDLGCGFGKSTWSLKQAMPQAEVIGVDLAAPCLQLAAEHAMAKGLDIRFRQADATATGLQAGSADLVTSTMLIHEIPLDHLPTLFEESARLCAPDGALAFLDFHPTGDAFRDFAIMEHGARNNEPYMAPMMAADLVSMAEAAGFKNVRWAAFDERGAGDLGAPAWPKRREWHFPWAVLHGERAA
jgi:ubiquinone/menaquinone biosynthesis C-methylase UbiE